MSKGLGQLITIKFTQPILNIGTPKTSVESQGGVWTASGSYNDSDTNIAKDGSVSAFWESRATNYVQIQKPYTYLDGFKVYKGISYRPLSYVLSVSDDGEIFTEIKSGPFTATTGWETITLDETIKTNFIKISFGYSSRLYLYELVLLEKVFTEFKITGQEHKYVNGELINKELRVADVTMHPTLDNTYIQLLMDNYAGRIHNTVGEIAVEYDASIGSLMGQAGAVESFTETFIPTDLETVPNPHEAEHIEVSPTANIEFVKINYNYAYANEHIDITPTVNINFEFVGIINP